MLLKNITWINAFRINQEETKMRTTQLLAIGLLSLFLAACASSNKLLKQVW
jgi:hypothetical protein